METIPISGLKVIKIKVWTYGAVASGTPTPTVNIYFNGWKSNQALNLPLAGSEAWVSDEWIVDSSIQSHIDGLIVRFTSGTLGLKSEAITIWAMYAEITTESFVIGPVNVAKWNGIETVNLAKWNGIAWSDLAKYNGID